MSDADDRADLENPFQAPTQLPLKKEVFPELAPGEFAVRGEYILTIGSVQLPAVCVRTGATQDLVTRKVEAPYYGTIASIMLMFSGWVFVMFSIMMATLTMMLYGEQGTENTIEAAGLGFGFGLLVSALVERRLSRALSIPITVDFFESSEWRQSRDRQVHRWTRTGQTVVVCVVILGKIYLHTPVLLPLMILVVIPWVDLKFVRVGRLRDGVYHITGLPTEFLKSRWGHSA